MRMQELMERYSETSQNSEELEVKLRDRISPLVAKAIQKFNERASSQYKITDWVIDFSPRQVLIELNNLCYRETGHPLGLGILTDEDGAKLEKELARYLNPKKLSLNGNKDKVSVFASSCYFVN